RRLKALRHWKQAKCCLCQRVWYSERMSLSLAPSMRLEIKPHSGILSFFSLNRGRSTLAIRLFAFASLLALPQHSFSPAALPSPAAGGGRRGRKNAAPFCGCPRPGARCWLLPSCRLASLRPKRYARTTVYPCDAGEGAITRYLVRALRTGRHIESSPIERTVPLQVTRRQNGDFLRLASLLRPRRFRPPRAARPDPRIATAQSVAFAPAPRCRFCEPACC